MRNLLWSGIVHLLSLLVAASLPASAGERLLLASGPRDTPAYTAGVGLASLIKVDLLPGQDIDLHPLESAGAVDNVALLRGGAAEFAIVPAAIAHAARLGIGSFAGEPPAREFRAIATLWRDALHLVVREDDVATGTIDDLAGLNQRKLFLGEAATGMIDVNRLLLSDLGLDIDQVFDLASVPDGDGISAIKRGDVDVFSTTVRPPEPMFDAVFDEAAPGLRLLDVTEMQMTRANGNHWLWTPYVIPAATYPGQEEDIWTIALSSLLVVRADVDSDAVYAITRSLFENLAYLKRIDPLMDDLSPESALSGVPMPLHAGALRYFAEAGLIPTAAPDEEAASPASPPLGQDDERPDAASPERYPAERYPDDDVAGDWLPGVGGPLLMTTPPGKPVGPGERGASEASEEPVKGKTRPDAFWRRRAIL